MEIDYGLEALNRAEYLDDINNRIDEDYDEYLDYLDKCCDADHGHGDYPVKPIPPANVLIKEGSCKERPVKSIPAKPMLEKSSLTIESSDSKFWCDLIQWLDDYKPSDPSLTTIRLNN